MRKLTGVLVLALLTLGLSVPAEAGFITLRLTDSGTGFTTTTTTAANLVSFSGTVGDYLVSLSGGSSNNPGAGTAEIHIVNLAVSKPGSTSGTLTIELSQTDFSSPVGPVLALHSSATATFSNSPGGDTVAFTSYVDSANSLFGTGAPSPTLTFTSSGALTPEAFAADAATVLVGAVPPYALTSVTTVTLGSSGTLTASTTGDTVVSQVPESGSTLAFFGLVALGLGVMLRRKDAESLTAE